MSPEITRSLLAYNATVDAVDDEGSTPLVILAQTFYPLNYETIHPNAASDLLTKATLLLDAGADPNKPTRFGQRPLRWAIKNNKTQLAKLLLERGADPGVVDESGDNKKSALDVLREVGDCTMAADLAPLL